MPKQCGDAQQKVNEYFESSSEYWKGIYSDDELLPTIYQDRRDACLCWISRLDLSPDARILEIGCGAGLMAADLAGRGYTVDAMDSTQAMLEMTRTNAVEQGVEDRIRLHLADAHALPFGEQTFDLIIAIGVIPWLHSEGLALKEMHRVLHCGGRLLITADNNARLNRVLDPRSSPALAPLRSIVKHVLQACGTSSSPSGFQPKRHYPWEVDRLIRGAGLKTVQSCTVGFGPFTFFGKELFGQTVAIRLHRRLQLSAAREGRSALGRTGSHYLVLAAKEHSSPLQ